MSKDKVKSCDTCVCFDVCKVQDSLEEVFEAIDSMHEARTNIHGAVGLDCDCYHEED